MDKGYDVRYNLKSNKKGVFKMYIDPNTGGMLFQALAVVLVAGSGVLMFFSRNIRDGIAKLRRKFRKEDTQEQQDK
jgi:hypothetical protein